MKNKKNKIRGFTLLEVLIAASILIIVTGAAAASAVMAINSGTYSRNRTVAENLAREEIERIRIIRDNSEWQNNLPLGNEDRAKYTVKKADGSFRFFDGERKPVIDHKEFAVSSEISAVNNNFNGTTDYVDESINLKKVVTTVSWQEGFWGGQKDVRIITYLANNKK